MGKQSESAERSFSLFLVRRRAAMTKLHSSKLDSLSYHAPLPFLRKIRQKHRGQCVPSIVGQKALCQTLLPTPVDSSRLVALTQTRIHIQNKNVFNQLGGGGKKFHQFQLRAWNAVKVFFSSIELVAGQGHAYATEQVTRVIHSEFEVKIETH